MDAEMYPTDKYLIYSSIIVAVINYKILIQLLSLI